MRATVDPLKVGVAVSDILAGLYAVIAILGHCIIARVRALGSMAIGVKIYTRATQAPQSARWVGAITKPNHAYSNACCAREGHSNVAAIFVSGGSVILWATPKKGSN